MIAKRLLALVVAVAMVVGAVVARNAVFGEGSPQSGDAATDGAAGGEVPDVIRLVCAEELETACEGLVDDGGEPAVEVRTEPVEDTLTALTEPDPAVDVWVTFDPWPEMAAMRTDAAGGGAGLSEPTQPLATSQPALVVRDDRITVLEETCEGDLGWRCVGELAGETWADLGGATDWGRVRIGLAHDPETSASGLLTLAQATAGYFGSTGFSAQDLRDDPGFFAWFSGLAQAMPPSAASGPLRQMVTQPGTFDIVGALDVQAESELSRERARGLTALDVAPPLPARVVAVGVGDSGPSSAEAVAERVVPLLVDAGWDETPAGAAEPGDTGTTEPDGLPSAGALEALRREWVGVS